MAMILSKQRRMRLQSIRMRAEKGAEVRRNHTNFNTQLISLER